VGFLRRGVIAACLKQEGKQPSRKERFASSAINSAKTAAHDLTRDGVYTVSSKEDTAIETENSHFRRPHSHLTPPHPANLNEYRHKTYIVRSHRQWDTSLLLTVYAVRISVYFKTIMP